MARQSALFNLGQGNLVQAKDNMHMALSMQVELANQLVKRFEIGVAATPITVQDATPTLATEDRGETQVIVGDEAAS